MATQKMSTMSRLTKTSLRDRAKMLKQQYKLQSPFQDKLQSPFQDKLSTPIQMVIDQPKQPVDKFDAGNFLNIKYDTSANVSDLDEDEKLIYTKIVNKLKLYYKEMPDPQIVPYLILLFKDFEFIKSTFPLQNFPFKDDDNANTIFGLNTKKNYIFNVACQEIYNKYTDAQKKTLSEFLMKSGADEKTHDISSKIETQCLIFEIPLTFPLNQLMYSMGLFSDEYTKLSHAAAAAAGGSRY